MASLVDEYLPVYDVSVAVATTVNADIMTTWDALMQVDLLDVGRKRPLTAVLGAIRMPPDLVHRALHGHALKAAPRRLRLRDTTSIPLDDGGWVLLGERPHDEIALGLVGKFWQLVIQCARVTAGGFRDFAEPGYAKTVYSLSVRPLDDGRTLLSGVMRTETTDAHARRWFRRYWTLGIGSGAHVLVSGLLDVTREAAEAQACEEVRLAS